ncbi:MAG: carbamoyl phosphate synthase large subunit, partial [Kiritimatiellia bacterium]|nr:carbamoyl phosphate synthase large subunit [Kiritimatiellia bacterium]
TVPFVSKATAIPLARIATLLMLGKKISDFPELKDRSMPFVVVKEAVFPFNMFPEVDPTLGPEMKATGEVMGIDKTFEIAFYKAQEATGVKLPRAGSVLLTVADKDKPDLLPIAEKLQKMGFKIFATEHTQKYLQKNGIDTLLIKKLIEGRPNIPDAIKNNEIHLIINTPAGKESKADDSYIRTMAIQHRVPYITTMAAARASVDGIEAIKNRDIQPLALQDYHAQLKRIG